MTPLPLLVMVLIHMLVKYIKKRHVVRKSDLENNLNKDCMQTVILTGTNRKQSIADEDNPLMAIKTKMHT